LYAIIDIETTGGNARSGRITEVAIIVHDGMEITQKFSTLINPEMPIPPYIQSFTGISDRMVAKAPKFFEVAAEIVKLTEDKIFVAHNVNFDFGFIREEFARLGYQYRRDLICTVKLSRRLVPGLPSYSLGNLCHSLGIDIKDRHRALGDAEATAILFDRLLRAPDFQQASEALSKKTISMQTKDDMPQFVSDLPEESGVYYLENDLGEVIYVGKAKNIRQRVKTHFSGANTKKAREMSRQIVHVHAHVLHSEAMALVMESMEIARLMPRFNVSGKKPSNRSYMVSEMTKEGYLKFDITRIPQESQTILAGYSSAQKASQQMDTYINTYSLCGAYSGVNDPGEACFRKMVHACLGACTGEELADTYNRRANALLRRLLFHDDDFVLVYPASAGEIWLLRAGNHRMVSMRRASAEVLENPTELPDLLPLKEPGNNTLFIIKSLEEKPGYLFKISLSKYSLFPTLH
jgi:DNA polymerase-3 subunit epsilon